MTVTEDTFAQAVARLSWDGPPRVWSLIVTVFGDLALARGEELSGTVLTRLAGLAQIRPEALRVALHRLKRDGWIESRKAGRESHYGLTAAGRAESDAASPVIYAAGPPPDRGWHVLIAGGPDPQAAIEGLANRSAYIALGPGALLGPGPPPADPTGLLALEAGGFLPPEWLTDTLFPADLRAAAARLGDAITEVSAATDPGRLSPLETAVLRLLAVHGWRRIALRVPDLPPELVPADWAGERCRDAVHGFLARLPRPTVAALEDAARAVP